MRFDGCIIALALGGLACDDAGRAAESPVEGGSGPSTTGPGVTGTAPGASALPSSAPEPQPLEPVQLDPPDAGSVSDAATPVASVAPSHAPVPASDAGGAATPSRDATSAPVPMGDANGSLLLDAGASVDAGLPVLLDSFRLVVIGSSTAAGEGASQHENGWVSLLGESLGEVVQVDFEVENLSTGGLASDALVPGSGNDGNIDEALELDPDLVLVALAGSNDLSAGTSLEEFLERLSAIRETAREEAVPVFFLSTAPKDLSDDERRALADWTLAMRDAFEPCWVPYSGAPYSPCFIDVFDALANDSLGIASDFGSGDGIHLNDAGHEVIFEIAEQIVRPYVCSVVACEP